MVLMQEKQHQSIIWFTNCTTAVPYVMFNRLSETLLGLIIRLAFHLLVTFN